MAEAVVSTTLSTINDLLVREAKFLFGVSNQVEEIRRELEHLNSLLEDADSKQNKDATVGKWVREVKDVCYEIEDVLETYAAQVASKKSSGKGIEKVVKRLARLPYDAIALHKFGAHITRIIAHITSLRKRLQDHGILSKGEGSREANKQQWWLRQTYAHEVDEHIVGMRDEIGQLISLIVDSNSDRDHQVISICGMGGLGKTTLARKIYNHPKVKHCYEAFAWCCITQQCDIKVVLQDILKQLLEERKKGEVMDMNETELVRELNKVQGENKCLIVVDDIWEIHHWEMLSKAFVNVDKAKSKILLTTRKRKVAEIGCVYELRSLTEEEGWELLRKKAFSTSEEKDMKINPRLEDVGREIVCKCGSLPLAISVLGGILKSRSKTLSEWQMVSKNIDSHLSSETSGSIENVLVLSYNDLPYNLKACFLFMGIFKEDEEIEAKELYHLWTAEGMILAEHQNKDETMMDVAERNLIELASRSMVQVKMDNLHMVSRIKSCKLHDLIRDMCLKKGKEEVENFDMDVDGGTSFSSNTNARRLAIFFGDHKIGGLPLEQINNQFLRTLSLRRTVLQGRPKFKLCRVLVLQDCLSDEFKLPKEISKMVHLRYLSVKDSHHFGKLPSSISDLPYLETLDLRTKSVISLANNIFSKMKRLKHLYLSKFHCGSKKLRLHGLTELETLEGFDCKLCWTGDLFELVNLRYFGANLGKDDWSLIIDQIDSWKKIRWVTIQIDEIAVLKDDIGKMLTCRNLSDLVINNAIPFGKLPMCDSRFWPNLMRLLLFETKLNEDSMEFLKKLPNLRELKLHWDAFTGKEISCKAADFPQLTALELVWISKLEKWRVAEGALPNLSCLIIRSCKKLGIIPEDGFKYLTSLKELKFSNMPKEFKQKYEIN